MLEILIVENDRRLALVLQDIIELEQRHHVADVVDTWAGALNVIRTHRPDLALIDIGLGEGCTGIEIAARVCEYGIPALFATASPPPFPLPELAIGCLCKPYNRYSVWESLRIVEAVIRGASRQDKLPAELELYR